MQIIYQEAIPSFVKEIQNKRREKTVKTIAIVNLKGGVAKTTTCLNTAYILAAEYAQRVLVIDADSQCNTTEFLQRDNLHPGTLADLLRDRGVAVIERSKYSNVDLIPADEALMDLDLSKIEQGTATATCIRDLLTVEQGVGDMYDYCIIDCPPAFNAASCAALIAADEVVIPMKLDAFSLRGMANILRQVNNMRQINPKLRIGGILPTMYYADPTIMDAERQLRGSKLPVYNHIRRTPTVDRMTFAQEPLPISSKHSGATKDYRRFVEALMREVQ